MKKQGENRIQWSGQYNDCVTVFQHCASGDIPEALAIATVHILRDIAADGRFTSLLYGYITGLLMEARESQVEIVKIDLAGGQKHGADT